MKQNRKPNLENKHFVKEQMDWRVSKNEGVIGTGNWKYFPIECLEEIFSASEKWKKALAGVDRPWLCWNVNPEWCFEQQRLVKAVGWTPVVGTDGRLPAPALEKNSIFIDFNSQLKLPAMWMHFPLEFTFLFTRRLAFWHSDVLIPVSKLRQCSKLFESIPDGEMVADFPRVGIKQAFRRFREGRQVFGRRYFEVLGLTTAVASRDQFNLGTSWWRHPARHPNSKPELQNEKPMYDHGFGIYFWKKLYGGKVHKLPIDIRKHHFCRSHRAYKKAEQGKGTELSQSFDLRQIVNSLGHKEKTAKTLPEYCPDSCGMPRRLIP